jgi:hypothetical protein
MRGVRTKLRPKTKGRNGSPASGLGAGAERTSTRKSYLCDVLGMSPGAYEARLKKSRGYQGPEQETMAQKEAKELGRLVCVAGHGWKFEMDGLA